MMITIDSNVTIPIDSNVIIPIDSNVIIPIGSNVIISPNPYLPDGVTHAAVAHHCP